MHRCQQSSDVFRCLKKKNENMYGLVFLKNKSKNVPLKKPAIFEGSDHDEDKDDGDADFVTKKKITGEYEASKIKRQNLVHIEKALDEDPNVFQYDEVYDDMQSKKRKNEPPEFVKKKPKYMDKIIKAAEHRKKDDERRTERKIQKERELEGNEFNDKEAFVTTSYKEKLLEMQEAQEREDIEQQIEELQDIKKQRDLTGFYRNLLKQTVGEESVPEGETNCSSQVDSIHKSRKDAKFVNKTKSEKRNFRKRNSSTESSSEEEQPPSPSQNLDPRESDEERDTNVSSKEEITNIKKEKIDEDVNLKSVTKEEKEAEDSRNNVENEIKQLKRRKVDRLALLKEKFTKRTVGEVYNTARNNYLLRKQSRSSSFALVE